MNNLAIDVVATFSGKKKDQLDKTIHFLDNDFPIEDEILWNCGKTAFDIIERFLDSPPNELSESLKDFLDQIPQKLLELNHSFAEQFNPLFKNGGTMIQDPESGEMISEIPTLNCQTTPPPSAIEPYILTLDELFVTFIRMGMPPHFPYARQEIAAYFTLIHVDLSAVDVALDGITSETYTWPSFWPNRLQLIDYATQAIDAHFSRYHAEKSERMNAKRHSRRKLAVQLVTEHWHSRKSDYPSAEKAGRFCSNWLREQHGIEYEPRTVTDWIRKFAKSKSISLR